MRVADPEMRVICCKMRSLISDYLNMRVAGSRPRDAGCESRDAIAKCRGIGNFMAYLCNSFVLSGIDFIFGMVLV